MLDGIGLLQAEKACRDLVVAAAQAVDQQDYAALVALFTADAVLVRPGGITLHGRTQILNAYQSKDANRLTQHLICQHHIDVDPSGRAASRCKVLLFASDLQREMTAKGRSADSTQQVGVIEDQLVLTNAGWRIQSRHAWFELFTQN